MDSEGFSEQGRWWSSETVAVVTGGNKGIGFEIVRRLALEGLTVILTARDEARGLAATASLHAQGLQNVVFQKLDVSNASSVQAFAAWVHQSYGGLDILVNNAAVFYDDNLYENAAETMAINYWGMVNVTEALLPRFRASHAGGRIVTISSLAGRLQYINDEGLRNDLEDATKFNQEFVDNLVQKYLEACRSGTGITYAKNSYRFSKTVLNAYLRLLAQRLSTLPSGHKVHVRNVDPGFVATDMQRKLKRLLGEEKYQEQVESGRFGTDGLLGVEEGADTPVWLCLVDGDQVPSGLLWSKRRQMSYD